MIRRASWLSLGALVSALLAAAVPLVLGPATFIGISTALLLSRSFAALAVLLVAVAAYEVVLSYVDKHAETKRRQHKVTSVVRLLFLVLTAIAVLGVATDRWVPALVSLGVVGVAVSLALQQPLLSLLGWAYIVVKEPYQVGDRVAIEGSKGDVIDVDYLVTTLWEVGGELRLRYLVRPRRGAKVRNELYDRILDAFDEHPDRVGFPTGRNR